MNRILASALLAAPFLAFASPAAAQDAPGDKVNIVTVYGDDPCQPSSENEIVICERLAEADRFRIPENLRGSDSPRNVAWGERVERLEMIGDFGTLSCSPAGVGGFTGCTEEMITAAYRDRTDGQGIRFGQLIQEAREERLSTIDADAALEQERVDAIERQYLERLEAERDAPVGDEEEGTAAGSALPASSAPPPPGE